MKKLRVNMHPSVKKRKRHAIGTSKHPHCVRLVECLTRYSAEKYPSSYTPNIQTPIPNGDSSSSTIRENQRRLSLLCSNLEPMLQFSSRSNQFFSGDGRSSDEEELQELSLDDVIGSSPWDIRGNVIYCERETFWAGLGTNAGGSLAFPQNSSFYWGDIKDGLNAFQSMKRSAFKVIVADPPWPNRSVTRGGGGHYSFLSKSDLLKLGPLLKPLQDSTLCYLGLWVTNSSEIISFAIESLMPAWGFSFVMCWPWVKITATGEPVCSPASDHKKPIELLLVGCSISTHKAALNGPVTLESLLGSVLADVQQWEADPLSSFDTSGRPHFHSTRCIIGCPLRHSWKPKVARELLSLIGPVPEADTSNAVLELFARELCPGTTSVGDEVLLFQTVTDRFQEGNMSGFLTHKNRTSEVCDEVEAKLHVIAA